MMYLETPPRLIETTIFSAMPERFRCKGVRSDCVLGADISELN
ncbi:hypothetical protein [Bradyrhizobium arachidis]